MFVEVNQGLVHSLALSLSHHQTTLCPLSYLTILCIYGIYLLARNGIICGDLE